MVTLRQSATQGERMIYNYIETTYNDCKGSFCYEEFQIDEKYPGFGQLSFTLGVLIVDSKDKSLEKWIKLTQGGP